MSTDAMIVFSNLALVVVTGLLAFVTVELMIKEDKKDTLILKIVRMFTRNNTSADVTDDADDNHHGRHEATDHYGKHAA